MAKEKEEQKDKKENKWEVRLVITNEEQPPKKVFVKGEKTSDLYAMIADIRNEMDTIKETLLS